MKIMTKKEALKLLGLNENYTESELKKAYHKLSMANHPDTNPNADIKTMQKINEAYNLLKSHKGKTKYNNNFESFIQTLLINLSNYKSKVVSIDGPDNALFKKISNQIDELIYNFSEEAKKLNSKNEIFALYIKVQSRIRLIFKYFKIELLKGIKIDGIELDDEVDYECSFDTFYHQLIAIKQKYEYRRRVREICEKTISEYRDTKYSYFINKYYQLIIDCYMFFVNLLVREAYSQANYDYIKNDFYIFIKAVFNYLESLIKQYHINYIKIYSELSKNNKLEFLSKIRDVYADIIEILILFICDKIPRDFLDIFENIDFSDYKAMLNLSNIFILKNKDSSANFDKSILLGKISNIDIDNIEISGVLGFNINDITNNDSHCSKKYPIKDFIHIYGSFEKMYEEYGFIGKPYKSDKSLILLYTNGILSIGYDPINDTVFLSDDCFYNAELKLENQMLEAFKNKSYMECRLKGLLIGRKFNINTKTNESRTRQNNL